MYEFFKSKNNRLDHKLLKPMYQDKSNIISSNVLLLFVRFENENLLAIVLHHLVVGWK